MCGVSGAGCSRNEGTSRYRVGGSENGYYRRPSHPSCERGLLCFEKGFGERILFRQREMKVDMSVHGVFLRSELLSRVYVVTRVF